MKNFSHGNSKLKQKLLNNKLSIGSWVTIPQQAIIEILSTAGFEWLTIDLEHSAIDFETAQNLIGHIQANGMEALVRVSKNDEVIIKRVLDAGANGIIVPLVKNAEEAKQAVSFAKYPPKGIRGVGLSRAQHYGLNFESYKEWVNTNLVVIIQVEHIDAVNNIAEILDVEGVDGIIVGPYDLSASMGKPGRFEDKDVINALKKLDKITLSKKKPLGFHVISSNHEKMIEKINQKYSFLAFSLDFFFLGDKVRSEMNSLRNKL